MTCETVLLDYCNSLMTDSDGHEKKERAEGTSMIELGFR